MTAMVVETRMIIMVAEARMTIMVAEAKMTTMAYFAKSQITVVIEAWFIAQASYTLQTPTISLVEPLPSPSVAHF